MTYRITYADGQAFDVELASREALEWFIRIDFPDAIFGRGGGQITAWKDAAACRDGLQPVAVVQKLSLSSNQPG